SQANMQGMQINISVCQHDALGIGAGAAGVKKLGYRVLVNFHDVCLARRRGGEKILITGRRKPISLGRTIEKDERHDRREFVAERVDEGEELFLQKKHFRSGIIQDVSELLCCKPYV